MATRAKIESTTVHALLDGGCTSAGGIWMLEWEWFGGDGGEAGGRGWGRVGWGVGGCCEGECMPRGCLWLKTWKSGQRLTVIEAVDGWVLFLCGS